MRSLILISGILVCGLLAGCAQEAASGGDYKEPEPGTFNDGTTPPANGRTRGDTVGTTTDEK